MCSFTQSQDASDAEDEPICHFALPALQQDSEAASDGAPPGSEAPFSSLAAVHRAQACAKESLRADEVETPVQRKASVAALHHKVLRALPEPTPQFDFGLFVVRTAAMSRHADDIFPLLEDEEVGATPLYQRKTPLPQEEHRRQALWDLCFHPTKSVCTYLGSCVTQLMERSVVLDKYLGPPKEGAKRLGDRFMVDKLVADIPNVRDAQGRMHVDNSAFFP